MLGKVILVRVYGVLFNICATNEVLWSNKSINIYYFQCDMRACVCSFYCEVYANAYKWCVGFTIIFFLLRIQIYYIGIIWSVAILYTTFVAVFNHFQSIRSHIPIYKRIKCIEILDRNEWLYFMYQFDTRNLLNIFYQFACNCDLVVYFQKLALQSI